MSGREQRPGRKDWKQRPHLLWGKTGTTATLVQLERAPTGREGHGGKLPQRPGGEAGSRGRGLAGVSTAGVDPLSPPPSASRCSDMSPSHLRGQQQPQSQYLQVIHRADPPPPASSHLWDLVASLGVGLGGGSPKTDPSFSTSLFPDHWAWSSNTPHLALAHRAKVRDGATMIGGRAALLLLPPSYKVGFKLGRTGLPGGLPRGSGLGSVRLFSFAVGGGVRRG